MPGLRARDIVTVWEQGRGLHPLERGLVVLAAATPGRPRTELAGLTVGTRNTTLLQLRAESVGAVLECSAQCPACAERLELRMRVSDLLTEDIAADAGRAALTWPLSVADYQIDYRALTSRDMAAARAERSVDAARQILIERCVVRALRSGLAVSSVDLPDDVVDALAEALEARDPGVDLRVGITCPACEAHWLARFDIEGFLWTDLTQHAARVLREVHLLARSYAWSEAEILAMTSTRRQAYLELAGA